jgi:hypothetical protein
MITEDISHNFVSAAEKSNIHALGSDNQDLSELVSKETGKSLVSDSLIANIHAPGSDNQDLSLLEAHRLSIHAPANAQPNNISDINAGLLTGGQEINLHAHAGGSGGLTQQQIMRLI